MEFWTVMVITYGTTVFGADVSLVAYPSAKTCGDAIPAVYDTLFPSFPDLMIQCVETGTLSSSMRPKPRPEELGNE